MSDQETIGSLLISRQQQRLRIVDPERQLAECRTERDHWEHRDERTAVALADALGAPVVADMSEDALMPYVQALAAERDEARVDLAEVSQALNDIMAPTNDDDCSLTLAGRIWAMKNWWRDYAAVTAQMCEERDEARVQVVAMREALLLALHDITVPQHEQGFEAVPAIRRALPAVPATPSATSEAVDALLHLRQQIAALEKERAEVQQAANMAIQTAVHRGLEIARLQVELSKTEKERDQLKNEKAVLAWWLEEIRHRGITPESNIIRARQLMGLCDFEFWPEVHRLAARGRALVEGGEAEHAGG